MRKVVQRLLYLSLIWLLGWSAQLAAASSDQDAKIAEVLEVLTQLEQIPESSIPPALLANAEAIVVIPGVIKVGLVIGGRYGKGVVSLRQKDGSWSTPIFLSIKGGSVGWQIGAQSTDVILVFKSRKSVDGMLEGKITLGADAAIAAGPLGRKASASTDAQLKAEIYSYSRSRGLFAGIALDGAALTIEHQDNAKYYRRPDVTPTQIFNAEIEGVPAAVTELKVLLGRLSKS